jgi:hypothetical protein
MRSDSTGPPRSIATSRAIPRGAWRDRLGGLAATVNVDGPCTTRSAGTSTPAARRASTAPASGRVRWRHTALRPESRCSCGRWSARAPPRAGRPWPSQVTDMKSRARLETPPPHTRGGSCRPTPIAGPKSEVEFSTRDTVGDVTPISVAIVWSVAWSRRQVMRCSSPHVVRRDATTLRPRPGALRLFGLLRLPGRPGRRAVTTGPGSVELLGLGLQLLEHGGIVAVDHRCAITFLQLFHPPMGVVPAM